MAVFSAVARFSAVDRFSSVLARMEERNKRFAASSQNAFRKVGEDAERLRGRVSGLAGQLKSLVAVVSVASIMTMAGAAIIDYDKNIASLSAVTGVTGDALEKMKVQINDLAGSTKKSAADVAKGFEVVGSAMSQYLDDPKALSQITEAGILLSKASKMELEPALQSLTGAMNQFGLGAEYANKAVQILTAGEIVGSVSTAKAVEEMSKFGAVASGMNVSLSESTALIQTLGIKFTGALQSQIGTASKNLLLFMDNAKSLGKDKSFVAAGVNMEILGDRSRPLVERLKEMQKLQGNKDAMFKVFGQDNAVAGSALFQNLDKFEEWNKQIAITSEAENQAATNTATISSKLKELKDSFSNAIVGAFGGSEAVSAFTTILSILADNFGWVVKLISELLKIALPMFAAYKIGTIIMGTYNTILALSAILQNKNAFSLAKNAGAYAAYTTITSGATAVQVAFNAAMAANPVGMIIAGILLVIGIIALLVKHWDTLKAKFMAAPAWVKIIAAPFILAMAPILVLVNLIKKLMNAWDGIKAAFTDGGIGAGLKKLGGVLLSALIDPLVFFMKMLAKIPGLGSVIDPLITKIEAFQANAEGGFGVDEELAAKKAINTDATQNGVQSEIIKENKQTVDINVNDPAKKFNVQNGWGAVPVKVNGTTGKF